MSEPTCRWNRETEAYMRDGEKCRVDAYGDPTKHCTGRKCSNHIAFGELTCARCVGRARVNLKRIPDLYALMLPVAITKGVNSEAADLAAPAARIDGWTGRRLAMRRHLTTWVDMERITEQQAINALAAMEDDDEFHPYTVLTRWEAMIREDYDQQRTTPTSIGGAADYLSVQLGRIAQDEEQEFALLAAELKTCRQNLERVLSTAVTKQRGAPCPECTNEDDGVGKRLVREFGHWCDHEACERIHYDDDEADRWVCPRNRDHAWTHEAYSNWIEERREHTKLARVAGE